MIAVRDQPGARWLPSRFHTASFRLIALIASTVRRREPEHRGIVLVIDRHQNAFENHAMALLVVVLSASFAGMHMAQALRPAVAAILALPVAAILLQVIIVGSGLVFAPIARLFGRSIRHGGPAAYITFVMLSVYSIYYMRSPLWIRYVARAFIAAVAVNAGAAVIMWLLRRRVIRLEQQYGIAR